MWCWRTNVNVKLSEKIINGKDLDRIGEKRKILNNNLLRKTNWFGNKLFSSWRH